MDCIFNKWLKCCEGAKLSGGMENGVLHEEERERFLRTHSNTLKCSHILYNIILYIS